VPKGLSTDASLAWIALGSSGEAKRGRTLVESVSVSELSGFSPPSSNLDSFSGVKNPSFAGYSSSDDSSELVGMYQKSIWLNAQWEVGLLVMIQAKHRPCGFWVDKAKKRFLTLMRSFNGPVLFQFSSFLLIATKVVIYTVKYLLSHKVSNFRVCLLRSRLKVPARLACKAHICAITN
jgi:hypothetical protein